MLSDNAIKIEKAVLATLKIEPRPTEKELAESVAGFARVFPVDPAECETLIRRLQSRFAITMEVGGSLTETDYTPWLLGRKASIEPFFWDRYKTLLGRQDWPPRVLNVLDRVSDEVLDLAGDPKSDGTWKRRGLVVGDIQSGKTAAYTALCCKAADAGYRLIILLTGTIESLRRQTQERLDEGFVGLDSSDILQKPVKRNRYLGVGKIDGHRTAGVFTSRSSDFSRHLMNQLGFRIDSFQEPVLVVLKKNKRVLENFERWVASYNVGIDDKIDIPLLLIDDEADSASINTNDPSSSPTAINQQIRSILRLFRRSSYVGVTATPFANVFINPETEDAMLGDDLFPRDYIYALEPPTNYIGPERVFIEPEGDFLEYISDAETSLPPKHKSTHIVTNLPESLISALYCFVLAVTIRDINGEGPTHRSMLVNVSRFTAVQNQVAELLFSELRELQREIRMYSSLPGESATASSRRITKLKDTWQRQYSGVATDWARIQNQLNASSQPMTVKAVNQSAGNQGVDYRTYSEDGLRIVAVGGNSLSRGLTLEGLTISYFFRNSQMYDTLLQMGRWFGYRDGYADLCRLWLTEEAENWYTHITQATAELRLDFKRMRALNSTPKEFGLKVRSHPDSLIVTARNKMRTAQTIVRKVSLSGAGLETAVLRSAESAAETNVLSTSRFIQNLGVRGLDHTLVGESYLWSGVPKDVIATFLLDFVSHPLNFNFQLDVIGPFVRTTLEPKLQLWDVAIPNGKAKPETFASLTLRPSIRGLLLRDDTESILVSEKKKRVGSGGIERLGLTSERLDAAKKYAKEYYKDKAIPDSVYRMFRDRPLLLVHIVRGTIERRVDGVLQDEPFRPNKEPLVAIGLSFPTFDDRGISRHVEYRVNMVEMRSMFDTEVGDDEIDEGDTDVA